MFETPESYTSFVAQLVEGDEIESHLREPHRGLTMEDFESALPPGYDTNDISDITKAELRRLGLVGSKDDLMDSFLRCEPMIRRCVDQVLSALPLDRQTKLANAAFRGVVHLKSTAQTYRSPEGYYAVLISSDLVRLLYLYASFVEAMNFRENLVFCSIDPDDPTPSVDLLAQSLEQIFDIVSERGFTPIVNFMFNDEGGYVVTTCYETMLAFVVSHEIQHIDRGDLEPHGALAVGNSTAKPAEDNLRTAAELSADLDAFDFLLNRFIPHCHPNVTLDILAMTVWQFFGLLARTGMGISDDYPHPSERFLNICRNRIPISRSSAVWSSLVPAALAWKA